MIPALPQLLYEDAVRAALREDFGRAGDLTSDAVVSAEQTAAGRFVARAPGRVAGLEVALCALRLLDPALEAHVDWPDGSDVAAGDTLAQVRGRARALLGGERVALNLLGRLCGIATATRDAVASVAGTGARVTCTRKTTPGLRALEKYAVRVGGGANHRFGLDDAVLIKDNHVAIAGGVAEALSRARRAVGHLVRVEIEVDTLAQLDEALAAGAEVVLLDNMSEPELREAVARCRGRAVTEASGGITPANLRAVALSGVERISLGWLTHSAPSLDVAFDLELG